MYIKYYTYTIFTYIHIIYILLERKGIKKINNEKKRKKSQQNKKTSTHQARKEQVKNSCIFENAVFFNMWMFKVLCCYLLIFSSYMQFFMSARARALLRCCKKKIKSPIGNLWDTQFANICAPCIWNRQVSPWRFIFAIPTVCVYVYEWIRSQHTSWLLWILNVFSPVLWFRSFHWYVPPSISNEYVIQCV